MGGQRAHYKPIQALGLKADHPQDVLTHLLSMARSDVAYLADLDAIQGGARQDAVIEACAKKVACLWLDAGFRSLDEAKAVQARFGNVRPVLGSETLLSQESLRAESVVLSLDQGQEGRRGDPAWWRSAEAWPDQVILMTLDRVGREAGPEIEALHWARSLGFQGQLFVAGGVRDLGDLQRLQAEGARGALVASALYRGSLP